MNDMDAEQRIMDNMPLVTFTIQKYYPEYKFDDDMFQDGCIGLIGASRTYDESIGEFSTYAVRCIRSAIGMRFRKKNAKKRQGEDDVLSLDLEYCDHGGKHVNLYGVVADRDPIERYMEKEMARETVEWLKNNLPPKYKMILEALIQNDFHQQTVGDALGLTQGEVSRKLKKIREIATNYMNGIYDEESAYQSYKWFVDKSNSYYRPKGETK